MQVKKTNGANKEVEIITDKYEIYVHIDAGMFTYDCFNSKIANNDAAYEGSDSCDDFQSLGQELKKLGAMDTQIVELKKIWKLT